MSERVAGSKVHVGYPLSTWRIFNFRMHSRSFEGGADTLLSFLSAAAVVSYFPLSPASFSFIL